MPAFRVCECDTCLCVAAACADSQDRMSDFLNAAMVQMVTSNVNADKNMVTELAPSYDKGDVKSSLGINVMRLDSVNVAYAALAADASSLPLRLPL